MKYDLTNEFDRQRFRVRVESLLSHRAFVELKDCAPRSIRQNSYLHLLIGVVAMETGNDLRYTKEAYFKRIVNPHIFVRKRHDKKFGEVEYIRSTSELTSEEMREALDRFIKWGNENGIYMPAPGDNELLRLIEIQMGRQEKYL
jgi:hypothetical protein